MSLLYLTPLKTAHTWNPGNESLTVWFRMDNTTGSGGSLTLVDKGPNGYNATVGGGSPSIVTNVINGQNILRLNGSTDYLTFAGTNILMPINSPSTVVIIAKSPAALGSGAFGVMLALATQAASYEGFYVANSSGYGALNWGGGNGTGGTYTSITSFNYYSSFYGLTITYNGGGSFGTPSNFNAYTNNSSQTITASSPSNTAQAKNLIGAWPDALGSLNYTGDIAEIIVFSSVLNSTKLAQLHTYLNTRYGVGVG